MWVARAGPQVDPEDILLTEWNCSMLGVQGVSTFVTTRARVWKNEGARLHVHTSPHTPVAPCSQTAFQDRFYELRVTCTEEYPNIP